jgi:hypothetical protein
MPTRPFRHALLVLSLPALALSLAACVPAPDTTDPTDGAGQPSTSASQESTAPPEDGPAECDEAAIASSGTLGFTWSVTTGSNVPGYVPIATSVASSCSAIGVLDGSENAYQTWYCGITDGPTPGELAAEIAGDAGTQLDLADPAYTSFILKDTGGPYDIIVTGATVATPECGPTAGFVKVESSPVV